MKNITSLGNLKNKTVIVRTDFNVPLKDGKITDTSRIDKFIPTLTALKKQNAKMILVSHLGRPKGQWSKDLSLKPIAEYLKIPLIETPIPELNLSLKPNEIVLLENIRFYPGEEKNDIAFAKQLARLGDLFINDGFSVAHRAHASTEGITHFLPSAAGPQIENEIKNLDYLLNTPKKPAIGLFGGAKISTKAPVLFNLMDKLDTLILGGAMANTFLKAQGFEIGNSLFEETQIDVAKEIIKKGQQKIILPVDVAVKTPTDTAIRKIDEVGTNESIMDIGPETIALIKTHIEKHKTLLWNGPFGVCEIPPFEKGTYEIVKYIAHQKDLFSVTGGGDIHACLEKTGVTNSISYASTAGGAFLSYISGEKLPGLECLKE
ncbi:MAG: phosphoglycerate kinase [Alphaproteobacteria bacterium]|nr:phosphoglycerate kinase [Alphaproteobacteria bacterium]MBN2779582.1 phosphoglycerate kinase [Alphaproteobacteria bacterium]